MEEFDPTKIIAGAGMAVGAAIMYYLSSGKKDEPVVEEKVATVSKKQKKQQKKKEKAKKAKEQKKAAAASPQQSDDDKLSKSQKKRIAKKERDARRKKEEAAELAKKEAAAKAAAAAAAPEGGKKKKKKKKKKNAAAQPATPAASAVATPAAAPAAPAPAVVVQPVDDDEEGWSMVEVRRKPKKKAPATTTSNKEGTPEPEPGITVELKRRELAAVIGSGGKNIQNIQTVSGARVNIPRDGEGETRLCHIIGTPEQMEIARELVLEYAEHGGPKPECTVTFTVNNRDGNLIIGERGSQVKSFQNSLEVRIDVSKVNKEAANVIVSGGRDEVSKAIVAIKSFISANNTHKMIRLDGDRVVQALFGDKGSRKKEIQDSTKAWLEILKLERVVKILGTAEQVDKAAAMVMQTIELEKGPPQLASGEVYEKISAGGATGQIVGSGGRNIQGIQEKTGAKIDLKDDNTCYVYGKPAAVKKAFAEIKDIVTRYEENMSRLESNGTAATSFGGAAAASATSGVWDVPPMEARWGSTFQIPNEGGNDGWGNMETQGW